MAGYDISASLSNATSLSSGPVRFGTVNIGQGVGGGTGSGSSVGIIGVVVAVIAVGLGILFFFRR